MYNTYDMTVEGDHRSGNKNTVHVFWFATNPSDPENDDGTHVGGWIRDQIRANIEKVMGGLIFPVNNSNQDKDGD